MKKIYFLIAVLISINTYVFSQIELEHTFNGIVTTDGTANYLQSEETNFFIVNDTSNVYIYNKDYSLYKQFKLNEYKISQVLYITKDIINNDDKLELVLFSQYPEIQYILITEDGNIIKIFEGLPYIIKVNGKYKIGESCTSVEIINGQMLYKYATNIYSINKGNQTNYNITEKTTNNFAYPNPAQQNIYLTYSLNSNQTHSTMNIYNTNGLLIETKIITNNSNNILLDISNYPKGIYLYEVNGISQKFIVK